MHGAHRLCCFLPKWNVSSWQWAHFSDSLEVEVWPACVQKQSSMVSRAFAWNSPKKLNRETLVWLRWTSFCSYINGGSGQKFVTIFNVNKVKEKCQRKREKFVEKNTCHNIQGQTERIKCVFQTSGWDWWKSNQHRNTPSWCKAEWM